MTELQPQPVAFEPDTHELSDAEAERHFTAIWGSQFVTARRTPAGLRMDKAGIDYEITLRYEDDDTTTIVNVDVKRVLDKTRAQVIAGEQDIALEYRNEYPQGKSDGGWVDGNPKRSHYVVLIYSDGPIALEYRLLRRVWATSNEAWLAAGARTNSGLRLRELRTKRNGRVWVTKICWVGFAELAEAMIAPHFKTLRAVA